MWRHCSKMSSRPSDIIKAIIDYINYNKDDSEIPQKIHFDLLSIKDDSICISSATQQLNEFNADVCPNWVQGELPLKFIYRRMVATKESTDYEVCDILDSLVELLRKGYKEVNGNVKDFFIFMVTNINSSKLERVYENGCKDYSATITVVYQREL
jgi:hypothetical protein